MKINLIDSVNYIPMEERILGTNLTPCFCVCAGLGPGGLNITETKFPIRGQCVPGSSHGGTGAVKGTKLKAGPKYDEDDITSLLGGSGGETVFVIIFCYLARIFHPFSTRQMPYKMFATDFPTFTIKKLRCTWNLPRRRSLRT